MKTLLVIVFLLFYSELFAQTRVIHVLVALCDNVNQGIVPVPAKIGNGLDPANNLYWGCPYGVKTFFKKQKDWSLISQVSKPTKSIIERLVFKHKDSSIYLIADAYDGAAIQQTTIDFIDYSAGKSEVVIVVDGNKINVGGKADLLCYVGHDGLMMDFRLENYPVKTDNRKRDVIILACVSKEFFGPYIKKSGAYPLLWTTNLMCPEAYTLDAAIDSWIIRDSAIQTREKSAQVYHQYQKCGLKGAKGLLVTGF